MSYWRIYHIELAKYKICCLFKRIMGRLCTPMDICVGTLESIGYWNPNSEALDMFGMFGLWQTKDYSKHVKHIDFFEIDEGYIKYAQKVLRNDMVTFFCDDSIRYISETEKKYQIVIADIPYGGDFYNNEGLPKFMPDILRVLDKKGVAIVNIHKTVLKDCEDIRRLIKGMTNKNISEILFVKRNEIMAYLVVCLDECEEL